MSRIPSAEDVLDSAIFGHDASATRVTEFFATLNASPLVPHYIVGESQVRPRDGNDTANAFSLVTPVEGLADYTVLVPHRGVSVWVFAHSPGGTPIKVGSFSDEMAAWQPDHALGLVAALSALAEHGVEGRGPQFIVWLRRVVTRVALDVTSEDEA